MVSRHRRDRLGKQPGGVSVPLVFGVIVTSLIFGTFMLDIPIYFNTVRMQQTSNDASVMAAAHKLYTDTTPDSQTRLNNTRTVAQQIAVANGFDIVPNQDVIFGTANPVTHTFTAGSTDNTNYAITSGYNAVRVKVASTGESPNGQVPALLGPILQKQGYDANTASVAMFSANVTGLGGLRPMYVCEGAWNAAVASGDPTHQLVTLYNNHLTVGSQVMTVSQQCGDLPTGSFGFSDFNLGGGAPGASTVGQWWDSGYPGQVHIGQAYTPQTGNQINTYKNELTDLIDSQTVFSMPLYNTSAGGGSGAQFVVSGFVGFVLTDIKTTGPEANRYIRGYFRKVVCESNCTTGGATKANSAVANLKMIR